MKLECDECGAFCRISYDIVETDFGDEKIPIYAECPECGWSVC